MIIVEVFRALRSPYAAWVSSISLFQSKIMAKNSRKFLILCKIQKYKSYDIHKIHCKNCRLKTKSTINHWHLLLDWTRTSKQTFLSNFEMRKANSIYEIKGNNHDQRLVSPHYRVIQSSISQWTGSVYF